MSHTPGPLFIRDGEPDGVHVVTADNVWVAKFTGELRTPQDMPNARLFAAAPELFKACSNAQRSIDEFLMGEWSGDEGWQAISDSLYEALRKAVECPHYDRIPD